MRKFNRNGVTVLEFLLVLPLLVMLIMAAVELGILESNRQNLEMATRAGALEAVEVTLPLNGQVPTAVLDAIALDLSCQGIDLQQGLSNGTVMVRLEHNVAPGTSADLDPPAILTSGTLICPAPNSPPPPDPDLSIYGRRYVRLSVCVSSELLAPNLLKTYCFDLSTRVTGQTKTYRYEQ